MNTIHVYPIEGSKNRVVLIEDVSRPIMETKKYGVLFKCVDDAVAISGLKELDVVNSAENEVPAGSGYQFAWPSPGDVAKAYPRYRTVHHPQGARRAIPVTMTFKPPKSRAQEIHYPSISAVAACWNLSVAQVATWRTSSGRASLPPAVVGVKFHPPGWEPPDGYGQFVASRTRFAPDQAETFFECKASASGVAVKYVGPQAMAGLREVPYFVLANARWR